MILTFSLGKPFFDLLHHLAGQKLGSHQSACLGNPGPSTVVLASAFGVRLLISTQYVASGRDQHHLAGLGYYFGIVLWARLC